MIVDVPTAKVALVTGAARGIGRASAIGLARSGCDIACNFFEDSGEADEVCKCIEALGQRGLPVKCDVGNRAEVERMFDVVQHEFGRLDVLVNNAAFSVRKPFLSLSVNDVERTWAVSLWGVFHCSQIAAKRMVDQGSGGCIVVISSVHSFRPYPNASAYNGAKAAVNQMAATWARELAPHQIRVNVVEPGWIDTPGERSFHTDEFIAAEAKQLPFGRLGTPEEVAKAVAYLASHDAAYVTGSVLRIDGGYSLIR